MGAFNLDSKGLTKQEFLQAVHRFSRRFFLAVVGGGVAVYLVIVALLGFHPGYIFFPGSVVAAIILFFEMKAQGNYAKFDYMGTVLHLRFEKERWVVVRNKELDTRAEFTWAETSHMWETKDVVILCPYPNGAASYSISKRSFTKEQLDAVRGWFNASRKK